MELASFVLMVSGTFALAWGLVRGYAAARTALVPLVRAGDQTRSAVEATQPVHERARIRLAVRSAALAVFWIGVAMYGLYLLTVGFAVQP
ncbi:MAG: hypothetical protein WCK58_05715 [Chloroflexota bacterium]